MYESHAAEYEALVSREDYQGNILKSIQGILAVNELDILDLGAGTGRLAGLLAPLARSVWAFDISPHMLRPARDKLRAVAASGAWLVAAADHRSLPLPARTADLVISGWSVSYVATWYPESWRAESEAWLQEARRVLRPGGSIILLESLGTGNKTPQRLPHLEAFYDWLEEVGFSNTWIRTDYCFDSPGQADELVGFFFGDEMRRRIARASMITLPECTGVWWKRV